MGSPGLRSDPWLAPNDAYALLLGGDVDAGLDGDDTDVDTGVVPLHVLFIEDDVDSHERVRRALAGEQPPITLECVRELSIGAERLRQGGVGALLIDLSLPDSDHHQTLARLRELVHDLPVVVLTASGSTKEGLALVRKGAQDYIPKDMKSLTLLLPI